MRSFDSYSNALRQHLQNIAGGHASFRKVGKSDRSMSFGQTFPVSAENERNVYVLGSPKAEKALEMDMSSRRREQIVTAYDLLDSLQSIVDDDSQIVRRHSVVSLKNEIVDIEMNVTDEDIAHRISFAIRTQPQCGRSPVALPLDPFGRRQFATRPWIGNV